MKICHFALCIFITIVPIQSRHYKILVLPSGGATGIIPATLLQYLEQQTGLRVHSLFDEIWGSSCGAITAALLTTYQNRKAQEVVTFFEDNFSNYTKAYFICNSLQHTIGDSTLIKDTVIPLRILTAGCKDPSKNTWPLFDFSSDGYGTCKNTSISLAQVVKASCTVYPYVYRNPVPIPISNYDTMYCIDAGSLCCESSAIDPTAYFLQQYIPKLTSTDTLTVYFLANAFTSSIDYEAVHNVLESTGKNCSYDIKYFDQPSTNNTAQITIVNVPVYTDCSSIITTYLQDASFIEKKKIQMIRFAIEKVVGKDIAAPNMLAAGVIPVSVLKKEAYTIIRHSFNFNAMVQTLKQPIH